MPNWVANKIILSGKNVDKVFDHIIRKDVTTGEDMFDFNTLIKQPEELDITSGTSTYRGIELYLAKINPDIDFYGDSDSKVTKEEYQNIVNKITTIFVKKDLSTEKVRELIDKSKHSHMGEEGLLDLGEKAVSNVQKYGYIDWYEWRIMNWGCKWNADSTMIDRSENEILFYTPWAEFSPVIAKLAETFPDISIEYTYAEEQAGTYSGRKVYENGEITEDQCFSESKEAYEIYFDLWGYRSDYRYNEAKGTYEYIDDEEEMY